MCLMTVSLPLQTLKRVKLVYFDSLAIPKKKVRYINSNFVLISYFIRKKVEKSRHPHGLDIPMQIHAVFHTRFEKLGSPGYWKKSNSFLGSGKSVNHVTGIHRLKNGGRVGLFRAWPKPASRPVPGSPGWLLDGFPVSPSPALHPLGAIIASLRCSN